MSWGEDANPLEDLLEAKRVLAEPAKECYEAQSRADRDLDRAIELALEAGMYIEEILGKLNPGLVWPDDD